MRQDKFVELRIAQLHWNAVPRLAFGHLDPESIEILADSPHIDKRQTCKGFQTNSRAGKTCNQLIEFLSDPVWLYARKCAPNLHIACRH
jgi:hypothetical protein